MCTTVYFEGFVQNQLVFHSVAVTDLVRRTELPIIGVIMRNTN